MKKCGSTASKSLEQLVEATKSTSKDGAATTSVVQQKEEQSCQHFSLRGYVADMRVKDPKGGNPFGSYKNAESTWKRLQGPLVVPRWSRCENCVGGVVGSSTSVEQRLNAEQDSLQICIPVPGNNSPVENRATRDVVAGHSDKAPIEVIILDDSEDEEVIDLTASLEELTTNGGKASAGNGVTTNTLRQTEQRPCSDKGKNVVVEIEDDGEEFEGQLQETGKAIDESSHPWENSKVEDNDQTSVTLEHSRNLYRGPYGQAVLDELNARIASTANTLRNQHQQRRNIPSSSTMDLSLSLCIPGTKGNQKVRNKGISFESQRKRKGTVDALANVSGSSLKSRRQMEMGTFRENPFTSCEIIDLESASFTADATTRPVTTVYANYANADPTQRNYAKAAGKSFRPHEDEHGPVKKSGTGADPGVRNMLNMAAPHIGRPLSPINQVCILNRNPAEFSAEGPEDL